MVQLLGKQCIYLFIALNMLYCLNVAEKPLKLYIAKTLMYMPEKGVTTNFSTSAQALNLCTEQKEWLTFQIIKQIIKESLMLELFLTR